MSIVVDTNKIIAALLRDGTVRRVLFCLHTMGVELLSPRELVEELLEHIDEIAKRMGRVRIKYSLYLERIFYQRLNYVISWSIGSI